MKKLLVGILTAAIFAPMAWSQQKIQKDETLGILLSLSSPGIGQIYAGKTWRGVGILAAEAVCFGVVAGLVQRPKKIEIKDVKGDSYDIMANRNMKLSNGEIAGIATAALAGLGIYVWQVFDARKCVNQHNKEQGFEVGLGALPNGGGGLSLRLNF